MKLDKLTEATVLALRGKLNEGKKVTEATTDVNEVVDEYKEAYHKDLDLKTVPCVIARDKMLSGWGGAEGRNHYQVVLCADSTEAHNIANNMQAQAKREQLANVRVSFGVKLPSRASVAYCVGRNASAWNTGDSWYERYDTKKEETKDDKMSFEDWVDYIDIKKEYPDWFKDKKELNRPFLDVINDHMEELNRDYERYIKSKKKTEAIDENLKSYTITVSDGEQEESFEFLSENDFETVCDEVYSNVIY